MNTKALNSKMALFGDTIERLAEYLGITRQTLSSKLNSVYDFKQSEIDKIVSRYGLTPEEIHEIFFQ